MRKKSIFKSKFSIFMLLCFLFSLEMKAQYKIAWSQEYNAYAGFNKKSTPNSISLSDGLRSVYMATLDSKTNARFKIIGHNNSQKNDSLSISLGVGIQPIYLLLIFVEKIFFNGEEKINPFLLRQSIVYNLYSPNGSIDFGVNSFYVDNSQVYFRNNYIPGVLFGMTKHYKKNLYLSINANMHYCPTKDLLYDTSKKTHLNTEYIFGIEGTLRYNFKGKDRIKKLPEPEK